MKVCEIILIPSCRKGVFSQFSESELIPKPTVPMTSVVNCCIRSSALMGLFCSTMFCSRCCSRAVRSIISGNIAFSLPLENAGVKRDLSKRHKSPSARNRFFCSGSIRNCFGKKPRRWKFVASVRTPLARAGSRMTNSGAEYSKQPMIFSPGYFL